MSTEPVQDRGTRGTPYISAADVVSTALRHVSRVMTESGGHEAAVLRGLAMLAELDVMSADDVEVLSEMTSKLERHDDDVVTALEDLHDGLILEPGSSPCALALAGLAVQVGGEAEEKDPGSNCQKWGRIIIGAVTGAYVGLGQDLTALGAVAGAAAARAAQWSR